jgi:hypothetical protein
MDKSLAVIEQKTVEFYEDQVIAVRLTSGEVFVPLRPIVEGLGLDWAAQTRRINRDPVLAEIKMEPARNQVLLEGRLESHGYRLDDYERRLEDVESTLAIRAGRSCGPGCFAAGAAENRSPVCYGCVYQALVGKDDGRLPSSRPPISGRRAYCRKFRCRP